MSWDQSIFYAINGLAGHSMVIDEFMLLFAKPSSLWIPLGLIVAFMLWRDWRETVVVVPTMTVLFLLSDLIGAQVKHLVARPRPCHVLTDIHQLVGCGGTFSFPSNHALNTAAAAAFAQILYPATGWITWPIVAVVGFARVYVGAHYLTDVFGAWVIGVSCGVAAAWLLRTARSRFRPRHLPTT